MLLNEKERHNFWRKVEIRENGCWEFIGYKNSKGYGKFSIARLGKSMSAHRLSYTLCNGQIGDFFALHMCDNPPCVNPDHIFLGTNQDNMNDMRSKGRGYNNSSLTADDVLRIVSLKGVSTCKELSAIYDVSDGTISNIWTGRFLSRITNIKYVRKRRF